MTYFVFCIHNHQPVGNFGHVIEEAYQASYWPFLKALSKYPDIKLSLHNTGYLLDWIIENHPEYIELLKEMVKRGQVEIMGGGYYEPVLSVIPEEDRLRQITMLSDRIEEVFGTRPRGVWLAERVWEPSLPTTIRRAGLDYLVVDDYHFIKSGLRKDQLGGYYITEDQGNVIKIFPGNEALRYLIPFKTTDNFEEYMRSIDNGFFSRGNAAIYGDDGEKFGAWPGTHKWVFDEGWLEDFFRTLERNLDWIKPSTLKDYLDVEEPVGQIYLPNTSYMEMGEWALPPDASREYMELVEEVGKWGETGERVRRFLQGGTWRNFFSKYPESNWMHKRMLMVSREVKRRAESRRDGAQKEAERHLFKAQCNDAYWHGVFGGLYLPHLRTEVYRNLLMAENIATQGELSDGAPIIATRDIDADDHKEVMIRSRDLNLFLSPYNGGALFELDFRPKAVNLSNTLTRWPEGYHYKLERSGSQDSAGGAKSIHDIVKVKEEGLEKYLKYDSSRRASFADHFLGNGVTLESFYANQFKEEGDFLYKKYHEEVKGNRVVLSRKAQAFGADASVSKEFSIAGPNSFRADYTLKNLGERKAADGWFAVEFNLMLPCCDGPACQYQAVPDIGLDEGIGLGSSGEKAGVRKLSLVDTHEGVIVTIELDSPATLWRFPVHTVSLSEGGFEKIYQGSCLLFLFQPAFMKDGSMTVGFKVKAEGLSH